MMFRNSARLLFSNFSTVWKILLYKLVVLIIVFGLGTMVAMPIYDTLAQNNFFSLITTNFEGFSLNLNIYYILDMFGKIVGEFITIIGANISSLVPSLIGTILIVVVLGSFLNDLGRLAIAENLNGYMSSNAQFGFANTFVRKLKQSTKLSLSRLFINLPINTGILFLIYSSLPMLNSQNNFVALIAPLVIIIIGTLLIAVNITVFSGVAPAMVVHDCKVSKAYQLGIKAVGRRFFRTLSTSVIIVLSLLILNLAFFMVIGVAGLVVTLPTSIFLLAIFGMVMYYGSMGMRYYVDSETILTPKKLEEQDKLTKAKYII